MTYLAIVVILAHGTNEFFASGRRLGNDTMVNEPSAHVALAPSGINRISSRRIRLPHFCQHLVPRDLSLSTNVTTFFEPSTKLIIVPSGIDVVCGVVQGVFGGVGSFSCDRGSGLGSLVIAISVNGCRSTCGHARYSGTKSFSPITPTIIVNKIIPNRKEIKKEKVEIQTKEKEAHWFLAIWASCSLVPLGSMTPWSIKNCRSWLSVHVLNASSFTLPKTFWAFSICSFVHLVGGCSSSEPNQLEASAGVAARSISEMAAKRISWVVVVVRGKLKEKVTNYLRLL